jgi:RNA polymerase sigma-70 factor (ECF subfamily)
MPPDPAGLAPSPLPRIGRAIRFGGIDRGPGRPIGVEELNYEEIVALFHDELYRFAYSLARNSHDASELTQESYYRLLVKGGQLRDRNKVKSWLFTTLYRVFLSWKRHEKRFPHQEFETAENETPLLTPEDVDRVDSALVAAALLEIEEHYRAPLALFYLQSLSYREIADMLEIPIGTVMSRLSRGKAILHQAVTARVAQPEDTKVIPIHPTPQPQSKIP